MTVPISALAGDRPPAPPYTGPTTYYDEESNTTLVQAPIVLLRGDPKFLSLNAFYVTPGKDPKRPVYVSLAFTGHRSTPAWKNANTIVLSAGEKRYRYKIVPNSPRAPGVESARIDVAVTDLEEMVAAGTIGLEIGPTKDTVEGGWLGPIRALMQRLPRN